MRRLLCVAVFSVLSVQAAASTEEEAQTRDYINCLLDRRVSPKNITKEDSSVCLAQAGVPDPGPGARESTMTAWQSCLIGKAEMLDDRISPVTDIARAVILLCVPEWKAKVGALWMPPESKKALSAAVGTYGLDEGVQAVLLVRSVQMKR